MSEAQISPEDLAWARKYGWRWDSDSDSFVPVSGPAFVRVIENPMKHQNPGWVPWLGAVGALQMDAPFGDVRAAIRTAESIRRQAYLANDEMPCNEQISPLELLAMEGL